MTTSAVNPPATMACGVGRESSVLAMLFAERHERRRFQARHRLRDATREARRLDLGEVISQVVELWLEPPRVRERLAPLPVGAKVARVVEQHRRAEARAPGLQVMLPGSADGVRAADDRFDLNEPLTAIGVDPDPEDLTDIPVETLVHPLRPTALDEPVAALGEPRPMPDHEPPLLIEPSHVGKRSGSIAPQNLA